MEIDIRFRHKSYLIFFIFIIVSCLFPPFLVSAQSNPSSQNKPDKPHLLISTEKGDILIRLLKEAAPNTVQQIIRLTRSSTLESLEIGRYDVNKTVSFFDGLEFNYTKPNIEIITSLRPGSERLMIPKEINAESLGLDKKLIPNVGKAMDILQFKILKHFHNFKKRRPINPQLWQWVKKWNETRKADFLVGVSHKTVNEALGYKYKKGIQSYPVTRGSVSLKPVSHGFNGFRIVIALTDFPNRTGKWIVFGKVVEGFSIADAISALPSTGRKRPRFKPLNPVKIRKTKIIFQ